MERQTNRSIIQDILIDYIKKLGPKAYFTRKQFIEHVETNKLVSRDFNIPTAFEASVNRLIMYGIVEKKRKGIYRIIKL